MISLGRRDARKELGLRFRGGREMEDAELEEGEACSEHSNDNDDGDDASIDPDIALSYLDVKVQNVLGHFQKDFEGGVSAENLGAKFGGYGSFLPTYQRSPVSSQPITPPKNQNHSAPRSPNKTQLEGVHHGPASSLIAPQSVRREPVSESKASSSPVVAVRQESGMPSYDFAKGHSLRHESANWRCTNLPEQKLLKVRIKVGSDNLSTEKNAEIYSGLGLDLSPSSSLDDSPSGSERMFHGPQGSTSESPARILQVMTSFPVLGDIILSPLSDDLLHLAEKVRFHKGSAPCPVLTAGPESSGLMLNGYVKGDRKLLVEKKRKKSKRNEISEKSKSESSKNSRGVINILSKEEDCDALACEDLVSITVRLPFLSNSHSAADAAKSLVRSSNISTEASNNVVRDKSFSDLIKEETLEQICTHEDAWVENPKGSSARKILKENKASTLDSVPVYPQRDGHQKGEKHSVKSESNVSKVMQSVSSEPTDKLKQKAAEKLTSNEWEGAKIPSTKERSSSDGKKKLKASQNQSNIVADMSKDGSTGGFSSMAKKTKSNSDEYITRGELEDLKLQKSTGKAGDRYRDFFGDFELDQEENLMNPLEMSYENRQRNVDIGEKHTRLFNKPLNKKSGGKKIDELLTTEVCPETAPTVPPPSSGNGLTIDVACAATTPAATTDHWVCCDKCQKWRLLPLGRNVSDLSVDKWMCSMLNWLPGMNWCSISEEETTKAVQALNQVPAASQVNRLTNPAGVAYRITATGNQLDQNHENFVLDTMPSDGKKATIRDGGTLSSKSVKKKSILASVTHGGSNEVNLHMSSKPDLIKPIKTGNLTVEKPKHKQKEKHKLIENCSAEGVTSQSKMKGKRDPEEDLLRVSKKIRAEGFQEECMSDHVNIDKVGPSCGHGLPTMSSGKNVPKNNGCPSSKEQVTRKSKEKVSMSLDDVPSGMAKRDDRGGGKKRKSNGSYDTQVNMEYISNTRQNLQDSRMMAKEEFSDNEYRKEKKSRISRVDGKESSACKSSGKTERKGSHRKSQQLGKNIGSSVSERSLDGVDFSKRVSGSLRSSVAATSSSSKVSVSHKSKGNFHEANGSPVESVSSSPLRVLKQGKFMSRQRNLTEKDDYADVGFFAQGDQRRCLDGEDDGGSDRSGTANKKILEVVHHGSHESSVLDVQEKDFSHFSGGNAKQHIVPSPDIANHHMENGSLDYLEQQTRYSSKTDTSDRCPNDDRRHENYYHVNVSHRRKSGKGSSSHSKEKNKDINAELDYGKMKDSYEQASSLEVKPTDGKGKVEEKLGIRSGESEDRKFNRRDSVGLLSGESSKKERQSRFQGHGGSDGKMHSMCSLDATSKPTQKLVLGSEAVSDRGKLLSPPPPGGHENENLSDSPQPAPGSKKENGVNVLVSDSADGDKSLKSLKQVKKIDRPDGTHQSNSRDPLSNGCRANDLNVPSPVKRDSSGQGATNALKEATNMKHLADRLKNSGSNLERTRLYFEAALKFLHGASLLETCSNDNARSGEMIQSMQVYSSTAKLFEFCAHEYEKSKDMAAASLAYKCMEVAYMKVIYSLHNGANKDRHELQTALQMVPPGESPSSSASDVDNLNQPATVDKSILAKSNSSPQVTGSHIIIAQNRPNFVRLLNFAQDVNFAMEASRKSRIAFAAANASLGETQRRDGISSIKSALEFNFHDVEGLLRLVRIAIEAIGR